MAMIPVKLADVDDAPVGFDGATTKGKCATCTLCDHSASAPLQGGRKPAKVVRDALNALARTCPSETIHTYFPDRLPAGVRLEYLHRNRRLPCHLIGRELVGGGGVISKAAPVFAVCQTKEAADAAKELAGRLGDHHRRRKTGKAYVIRGWKVTVERAAKAAATAGGA